MPPALTRGLRPPLSCPQGALQVLAWGPTNGPTEERGPLAFPPCACTLVTAALSAEHRRHVSQEAAVITANSPLKGMCGGGQAWSKHPVSPAQVAASGAGTRVPLKPSSRGRVHMSCSQGTRIWRRRRPAQSPPRTTRERRRDSNTEDDFDQADQKDAPKEVTTGPPPETLAPVRREQQKPKLEGEKTLPTPRKRGDERPAHPARERGSRAPGCGAHGAIASPAGLVCHPARPHTPLPRKIASLVRTGQTVEVAQTVKASFPSFP